MKNPTRVLLTALSAALLIAGPALAKKPTAKNRQIHQQKRIGHGVRNGELTRPETVRLQKNAARIRGSVARDRRDGGVFTPRERVGAQKKLNRQSRAIYRQKHDEQRR